MRIAFLSVSSELGGSETSLLLLVRSLRQLEPDWDLTVLVPRDGPLARRVREAGGPCGYCRCRRAGASG